MSFLDKFLGDANERKLKNLWPIVDQINQLEQQFEHFSNEQIKEKTKEFKKRIGEQFSAEKAENSSPVVLDEILPEAFKARDSYLLKRLEN